MERRTKYLLLILSTILVGCSGMRQAATRNQPLDSAALLQMTSHSWDQEGRADFLFPEFSKLKESLTNPFDTGFDNNLAFKMSIGMDQGINQEGNVAVEETPEVLTTTEQSTATEQTTEIPVETALEGQIPETTAESVVELSGELTSLEETVVPSEQASNVTQEEELYEWMYVLECEEETSEGWITETIPVQEKCANGTSIEDIIQNAANSDSNLILDLGNETNESCIAQPLPAGETTEEVTEVEVTETCTNGTSIEAAISNMTVNDDLTLVTDEGDNTTCLNQPSFPEETAEEVTEEEMTETCSNKTSIEEVIGNMTTNDDLTLVTGEESPACENQSPPPEETVEETTEEETPEEVAEEATETIEEVVENEYPVTSENVTCLNDQPPQPVVETIVEEVTVCCTNESSIEFVIQEMFANDDLTLVTEAQSGLVGPVGLESRELVSNLTCRNDQPYRPLEIMEEVTEVCIEEEQAEEEAEKQLEEATEEIPPTEEIVEEETPVTIPEPEVEEEEVEATTEAEENQEQVEEEEVSEGETCNQYGNSIEEIIDNMYSDSNLRLVTGENETCGESQPVPPEQSEEETTEITQPTVPQEEETAEETIVIKEEEEETPEEVIPYVEEAEVTEETTEIIPPTEETVEVIEEAPEIIPQPEIEAGEISEETIVTEEAEVAEQIVPYLPVEEVTEETTERIPLAEETVEVVEETVELVEETPVIIPPIEEVVEVIEETPEIIPQPEIEAGEISEETIVIEEETAEIIVPYLPVEEAIEETTEIIPPTEETVEVIEETTEIIPPTEETVEVIEEIPEVVLPIEEVVEVIEETPEIIPQPEVVVEEESTEETTEIILPVEETEETVEKSCFDQDISMKPYDENYVPAQDATTYTDSTLTLREKIIFANALKSEDHETIELLENPASSALKFNKADLTSLGLTITDDDNYAYSLEMPWNGTFSLTYFVPINKISNNVQPIFSTNQFVVTASYNDPYITYTVSTETDTALTFTIENQSPDYDWWSTLSSEEKAGIFDNYIGQKVDLLFSGHDCWLSVTGVNDVHETSDTWSCLQPNVLQNSEVDVQDSKIRDHFGRFKLGFDGLVNQTVGDITVSNVYLIGTLRQLHIFRANLTVGETSNGFTSESCEIGWDWGKLSTLPPTVDSICSLRKYIKTCQLANLSSYGPIGVIDLSHAFKYLPEYVECGNVGDSSEGQSVRTHICSNYEIYAESQSIEYTTLKANSSLTFFDLIALSSDSDRANLAVDILGAAKHGKLYLVAEKFSRLRSVIPANFPIRKVNDVDFKFTLNILSYANEVLNADGSTILIKVGLKLRLFTSNTIDISFMIGRGNNFL